MVVKLETSLIKEWRGYKGGLSSFPAPAVRNRGTGNGDSQAAGYD